MDISRWHAQYWFDLSLLCAGVCVPVFSPALGCAFLKSFVVACRAWGCTWSLYLIVTTDQPPPPPPCQFWLDEEEGVQLKQKNVCEISAFLLFHFPHPLPSTMSMFFNLTGAKFSFLSPSIPGEGALYSSLSVDGIWSLILNNKSQ